MQVKAAEYDNKYKGLYYWGPEVHSFQPCNVKKKYWVSASSWVVGPAIEFVKTNTNKAYQPIYIEFRGHLLDEVLDGFATNTDGLIRISEIYLIKSKIPDECRTIKWVDSGCKCTICTQSRNKVGIK